MSEGRGFPGRAHSRAVPVQLELGPGQLRVRAAGCRRCRVWRAECVGGVECRGVRVQMRVYDRFCLCDTLPGPAWHLPNMALDPKDARVSLQN